MERFQAKKLEISNRADALKSKLREMADRAAALREEEERRKQVLTAIDCEEADLISAEDVAMYQFDVDGADAAMEQLKQTINEDIEVVLLHDYSRITTPILPDIINYLREEGYVLLPLFYESNMVHK